MQLKKSLGQHLLTDFSVCEQMLQKLQEENSYNALLEIGPGQAALTQYLLQLPVPFVAVDFDPRMIQFLQKKYADRKTQFVHGDVLKIDLDKLFPASAHEHLQLAISGNFPYNISSQIVFKILDNKNRVPYAIGMFQKELAQRVCARPGSKAYGAITVFAQAFFDCTYLFEIPPEAFDPPPKVYSAVIEMKRKQQLQLNCEEKAFTRLVKMAFAQRRKTLRNSLHAYSSKFENVLPEMLQRRPETLSIAEFEQLTNQLN